MPRTENKTIDIVHAALSTHKLQSSSFSSQDSHPTTKPSETALCAGVAMSNSPLSIFSD